MTAATRARWAIELDAVARAYWTPERTAQVVGGKQLTILPADGALLLRALGLLNSDASMPPDRHRKYLQINHMVGMLGPAFAELRARHPRVRLLDAGCGRSYLTLLLAWCGKHVWHHPIEVLGVDRNPAVIEECRRRTALAGLDDVVRFEATALEALRPPDSIHGVIALHACDTATCDALALGVALEAELLAVAPCCQAELARGWAALADRGADGPFAPVWRTPHLRRETAAHVTDAMRTLLLRAAGYQVVAIEFVPAEHTRKNTLIRAVRAPAADPDARAQYAALERSTGGVGLGLAARLGLVALAAAALVACGKKQDEAKAKPTPAAEAARGGGSAPADAAVVALPPEATDGLIGGAGAATLISAADDGSWVLACTVGDDHPRLVVGAGDSVSFDRVVASTDRDLLLIEGGGLIHVDVPARTRRRLGPAAHGAIDAATRRIIHALRTDVVVRDPDKLPRLLDAKLDVAAVALRSRRWAEVFPGELASDLKTPGCSPPSSFYGVNQAAAPVSLDLDPSGVEAVDQVGPQLGITAGGEVTLDGEVVVDAACAARVFAALADPPRVVVSCAKGGMYVAGPGGFSKSVGGHVGGSNEQASIDPYLSLDRRVICVTGACIDLVSGRDYSVYGEPLVWADDQTVVRKRGADLVIDQVADGVQATLALPRVTQEVTVDTATGRRRAGAAPRPPTLIDTSGRFMLYGRYLIDVRAATLKATLAEDALAVDGTGRVLVGASPGHAPFRWIRP